MRKSLSESLTRRLAAGLTLAAGLAASLPASAIVYTASNEVTGNEVIAFDVNDAGQLIEIGRFDTQGLGTGAPLGNQSALATDASDRWLFAVNPGDGTLTSFRLQETGLQFVDLEDSGGYRPISVTVFGTLVYVLNEGDGNSSSPPNYRYDNISGFRFTAGGLLEPIPNSTRILDRTRLTAPAQVGFNKSGTVLLITEKATDKLTTYVMRPNGTPAFQSLKRPSAVPTPFGFQFGDRDFVFVTEANGGGQGATVSYRIDRTTGAVSDAVDIEHQEDATCWTVLNSDQTLGYSTNTASGTVSIYRIGFAADLNPFFQRFQRNRVSSVPTGAGVRDAALAQDNQHLFTLNNGDGELRVFNVNRRGAIQPVSTAPVPESATGLFAR